MGVEFLGKIKHMTRNKKIVIAGGIILLIVISVTAYHLLFSAPEKALGMERFVVPLGVDVNRDAEEAVIHELKEKGFIRSEWAFRFALGMKDWQIKPGAYKISKNMDVWVLADTLFRFPYQKWVVIPEGLRKEEVAERAKEELGWSEETKEEFLANSEEGYLFPDTYLLQTGNPEDAGKTAAKRMKNQFNEKAADLFKEAAESNVKNDTLMVLASIIQREAANEQDMPLIAGVIWNRWLKGMSFEIDATIQYALGEPGNWWPVVKPEDYKLNSAYNTYLHEGRPPTPICNPGLAAIDAVINSEDSEYLYYLHDSDGQIHPAKTYEEHLKNIREYFWQSYKDEKLGYEMNYPTTWSITEERKDFGIELSRVVFQSKDYKLEESEEYKEVVARGEETGLLPEMIIVEGAKLSLVITEIPSDHTWCIGVFKNNSQECGWREWAKRPFGYYGELVSEKFLTLEGKETYERQVESGEITSVVISFSDPEETKLFELILHTLQKNKEKDLEILKQILSTFNFIKDGGNGHLRPEGVFAAGGFNQVHFLFKRGDIHPIF